MRIAHYLPRVSIAEGGVTRAVLDLTDALARLGEGVELLTYQDGDVPSEWAASDRAPRVALLDAPAGPAGLFSRTQLAAIARTLDGASVLHLHAPWTLSNRQLAAIARRLGVPYILSVHGMLDDWSMAQRNLKKRLYLAFGGRRMLERAAAVHCTAAFEEEQAKKWFPRGRAVTIPLVFDVSPFRGEIDPSKAPGLPPGGRPRLLFLSRLHEKKGLDRLLEAAAILQKRGVETDVLVAGTGEPAYERQMRELAARLGLAERTRFLGLVTGEAKSALYAAADLFVLPTSQENFGFVCPEALACGTAVVTTRGVDIWPELLESGGAEIVDNAPEPIAEAVEALLGDPERLAEMGHRGRAWVLDRFEGERVAREYQSLYRDVAGSQEATP
jgi:glycosyltransferase involved in cell wall biosynthesis